MLNERKKCFVFVINCYIVQIDEVTVIIQTVIADSKQKSTHTRQS